MRIPKKQLSIPIICVGNAIAGGAGKTPIAIELVKLFSSLKVNTHIIYKNYKIKNSKTKKVSYKADSHKLIDDEALILSQHGTTWISNNRLNAAIKAEKDGAELIILDDGMQDSSIYKDFTILVMNSIQGIGNGKLIN